MSIFKVNMVATNSVDRAMQTNPIEVLVDTGSELTWLPADVLQSIGIKPQRKKNFHTATKQLVTRDTGYAILAAEGF